MNPIPLTAPDGRVYAHACGHCHRVADRSIRHAFFADLAGPEEARLARSIADAAGCCTCSVCGIPVLDLEPTCADCSKWICFAGAWFDIGTALVHGLTTEEEWRAFDEELPL